MTVKLNRSERRRRDPYWDQRSGEDRRMVHLFSYFSSGGKENRDTRERRVAAERRKGYLRVTRWSSVWGDALSYKRNAIDH